MYKDVYQLTVNIFVRFDIFAALTSHSLALSLNFIADINFTSQ